MLRSTALVLLLLTYALSARADISPPELAKITLELNVDGQASLPLLRFFVTNCVEPVEKSVLEPDAPLVCSPKSGPVRVYGFREGDLVELLDMIRKNAGPQESAAFLAKKAKTCGEVSEQDRTFLASSGVAFVAARYKLEPGPKGGCKLTRISAITKTRAQLTPAGDAPPAASVAPAAPPPAPSAAPVPAPAKSDCGCRAGPMPGSAPGLVALGLALCLGALRVRTRSRGTVR